MATYSWDTGGDFSLTVRCEHPDAGTPPTEVTFRLSLSYGIHNARDARDWFLGMIRAHEEFQVETDKPGEPPLSFLSRTVKQVLVE